MIRWLERKKVFSIILFILIVAEIFFFSSISGPKLALEGVLDPSIIYHFCVFFLLNFFLLTSINGDKRIKLKHIVISFCFSIVYSILDEVHQLFVPFRSPSFSDILTDSIGIFSSTLLYLYSKRSK